MLVLCAQAQNYLINFEASGPFTTLDSIRIENLTQSTTIVIQGDEILNLVGVVNIKSTSEINDFVKISPNPMNGEAEIAFFAKQSGNAYFAIYDIQGRELYKLSDYCVKGIQKYFLSGLNNGVYLFSIKGDSYYYSLKIISHGSKQFSINLEKIISKKSINEENRTSHINEKGINTTIVMPYTTGDELKYTGYKYFCNSELTDIPTSSKTVTFQFSTCIAPTVIADSISTITTSTARGYSNITSDGGAPVIARGVCWSTNLSPTIADAFTSDGTGTGSFTSDIATLSPNTTYYVRAYATNGVGTAYSEQLSLNTSTDVLYITSDSISNITRTSALFYGNCISDGGNPITSRGACWSIHHSPTLLDSNTSTGTGLGNYSCNLTTLTSSTNYYVRAYRINNEDTIYGNEISFTTDDYPNCGIVMDVDSNTYRTVTIGNQCWFRDNLKTKRLRNKNSISCYLIGNTNWGSANQAAYIYFGPSYYNPPFTEYGYYYNYLSANSNDLCPWGWRVPNDSDWVILREYLGGQPVAGGKLKETGTFYWTSPNSTATNETGYSAIGAGYFSNVAAIWSENGQAAFWSNTPDANINNAYSYFLNCNSASMDRNAISKKNGLNVRCIKEVCNIPLVSNAGPDQLNHSNPQTTISGNTNPEATGKWKLISGIYGLITDTLSPTTTFFGALGHEYKLVWTLTNKCMEVSTDTLTISYQNSNLSGCGTVTDIIGQTYNTITIGEQCWMKENLKVTCFNDGTPIKSFSSLGVSASSIICPSYTYYNNDSATYCNNFGALYNSYTVKKSNNVCPTGWHIPSSEEFMTLINNVGGLSMGGNLKDTSSNSWNYPLPQHNQFEFSGRGGGSFEPNSSTHYNNIKVYGNWWYNNNDTIAYMRLQNLNSANNLFSTISLLHPEDAKNQYSVRCLKNQTEPQLPVIRIDSASNITKLTANVNCKIVSHGESTIIEQGLFWSLNINPNFSNNKVIATNIDSVFIISLSALQPNTTYYLRPYVINNDGLTYGNVDSLTTLSVASCGTVTDIEGNNYNTVIIGSKCWFAENLKTTRYKNNANITFPGTNRTMWKNDTIGAYAWFDNSTSFKSKYGALYNWYAANNNNLCPTGWHVPSDSEWSTMEYQLGGRTTIGYFVKDSITPYWRNSNNIKSINSSGLTARSGGYRYIQPTGNDYTGMDTTGRWWTSTSVVSNISIYRELCAANNGINRKGGPKNLGFSVRCVSNGQYGPTPPTIVTQVSDFTHYSANCNGTITSATGLQITNQGFCWGLTADPTINDNVIFDTTTGNYFSKTIEILLSNSKYYIRAFIIYNGEIAYGNVISFTTPYSSSCGTIKDIEGNVYNTVVINSKCWMRDNLKTKKYKNEVNIASSTWTNSTIGQYTTNNITFGLLYNWYAVDSKKLCPRGWVVPTKEEWLNLINVAGGISDAGGNLKSHYGFSDPNYGATDKYGFYAQGGGNANIHGTTENLLYEGSWWSSTNNNQSKAWKASVSTYDSFIDTGYVSNNYGYSVRCVKDTCQLPTVSDAGENQLNLLDTNVYLNANAPTSGIGFWSIASGSGGVIADSLNRNTLFMGKNHVEYRLVWNIVNNCDDISSDTVKVSFGVININLSTDSINSINQISAKCYCNVINDSSLTVISRGVCWNTSPNPTINNTLISSGSGVGTYVIQLQNLTSNTTYYIRSYATCSFGTKYGNELSFTTSDVPNCGIISDIDGNSYNTVVIGNQCWLRENLKVSKLNDGSNIAKDEDYLVGECITAPAYNWEQNDSMNKYKGALYNGYAAKSGNVCPTGWRVPTATDWTTMGVYLQRNGYNYNGIIDTDTIFSTNNNIGKSLAATSQWGSSTVVGSVGNTDYPLYRNKTGFSAIPIAENSSWYNYGASWWSTTQYTDYPLYTKIYSIQYDQKNLLDFPGGGSVPSNPIRCIKN